MPSFDEASELIRAHSYPATAGELAASFRDVELELPMGSESLGDAFGRLEGTTFEDGEAARRGVYSVLGEERPDAVTL